MTGSKSVAMTRSKVRLLNAKTVDLSPLRPSLARPSSVEALDNARKFDELIMTHTYTKVLSKHSSNATFGPAFGQDFIEILAKVRRSW
jgi:hypothetical protein